MVYTKLCKKVIAALIFSSLTLTGCQAKANPEKEAVYKMPLISDVETVVSSSKKLYFKDRGIRLSITYQALEGKPIPYIYKVHSPLFIERVVRKTSDLMTSYLKNRGLTPYECRGLDYNLIVTVVHKSVMQDNNRFSSFFSLRYGRQSSEQITLFGYYDSTERVPNNSTVLVADFGDTLNERVWRMK
jgi:hypothetical protein